MAGVINHKRESSPFLYCWHVDWQVNRIFQICMCMAMFKCFFLNECVTWMCFKILLLVDRAVPKNSMDVLVMPCYQCQADKMENAERPSAMPHPHQIRRYFPFCGPNTLPSCCFLGQWVILRIMPGSLCLSFVASESLSLNVFILQLGIF